jgi:tRNA pseudouridine38-40 synthase
LPVFRLTLEYDGEGFAGWQVQPGATRTLQGVLEDAVARVTGQRVRVHAAGRTDAGVHAEAQVASLRAETGLPAATLARALNAVLPPDLAVVAAAIAPDGFHARFDARAKLYRYRIWNGACRSPLRARRALRVERPLDVEAMRRAAADFLGTHDFAALQAAGSQVASSVRTLTRCDLEGRAPGQLCVWVEADGFLRHMVRNLVGTLLEVGRGRRPPDAVPALLAGRDRRAAGPTAPAHALTLIRVDY